MRLNDAILIPEHAVARFEDDELAWLIGELDHAIDEAKKRDSLLYRCNPDLARAALDFFRRYHQRFDFNQAKPDFDSVRISDEEWARFFREKIRKICADSTAKLTGVRLAPETTP